MLLQLGDVIVTPGGGFAYVVNGPVCRLYDRALLPYPCCRLSWAGKEPSWNRIGRRFVPDVGAIASPSYAVKPMSASSAILVRVPQADLAWSYIPQVFESDTVLTLYWQKNTAQLQAWWYSSCKRDRKYSIPTSFIQKEAA